MSRSQAQRDRGFAAIVFEALTATVDRETPLSVGKPLSDRVAGTILQLLHERGLAIHDPASCIRPTTWQGKQAMGELKQPAGRAPSLEEAVRLGMIEASDDLP